jgi:ferric-dicitrate binding protein FerR (iron transport regulator)
VEDFIADESYLRYYFKENEADIAFWTEWIGLHPEKLDIIISANNYIDAFSVRLSESEFQKEQQRFSQSLTDLSLHEDLHPPFPRKERIGRKLIGIAALVITLAGAGLYTVFRKQTHIDSKEDIAQIEKQTPKGQHEKFTLPDGTEVELNADSKLTYPARFSGNAREIQLTGEAFFRVKKDSLHPFHVISDNLVVTVLGTSFNIRCYPDNNQMRVALVTGKVRLDRITDPVSKKVLGQSIILNPAEMGLFNKDNLSLAKTPYDIDEETGWRQGIVSFNNAGFEEIANRFDKIYNIKLLNKSHKKVFKFTGTFTNSSAEEIIKSICLSKKLSYTTNGNSITIH